MVNCIIWVKDTEGNEIEHFSIELTTIPDYRSVLQIQKEDNTYSVVIGSINHSLFVEECPQREVVNVSAIKCKDDPSNQLEEFRKNLLKSEMNPYEQLVSDFEDAILVHMSKAPVWKEQRISDAFEQALGNVIDSLDDETC